MTVAISCIILLLGFISKLPIFISVILAVLSWFFLAGDPSPIIAAQRIVGASENTTLLAIPFFILLGNLLNYTGITRRMLTLAELLTRKFYGGLAQANVLLSTLMGGLSASSLADCAMLCKMLVPEMTRKGYSKSFATVVTAAGSLITPIIPPGIALIIYGYVADVSIGKMFLAGIVPGILCCAALMLTIRHLSRRRNYQAGNTATPSWREFGQALWQAMPALILVLVIIGGIRIGAFTPTEAGAIAVVFAIGIGLFFTREMKVADIGEALLDTVSSTAGIMLIIMACSAFAWILSWERTAQTVAEMITSLSDNPLLFLLVLNLFLLVLGMFIEGNAAIIVLVPLLMPTVKALGIDPIQFGILIILNLAIGSLTPPMGTIMFIANSITGTPVSAFIKEVWPMLLALLAVLLLVTLVPAISTFLPGL